METMMGTLDIDAVISHYTALARLVPLKVITRESDYRKAVAALDALLDAGGADERHPLAGLVGALGEIISRYETRTAQQ
jgi:HTH-type transcriptional regulator/antitoxin HigA